MKTDRPAAIPDSVTSDHPPLARDGDGNPVVVPGGTAGWCLRRETGSRPRMIVGEDGEPARFSLDTTPDDLEAMLGAGAYRVYATTRGGEVIDYVTTIVVAPLRAVSSLEGPTAMRHLSEVNARLTALEHKFLNLVIRGEGGADIAALLLGMSVREAVAFTKDQVARAQAERTAEELAS